MFCASIKIGINPRRVAGVLTLVVCAVGAGYVATKLVQAYIAPAHTFGLYDYFHLGKEANLPSYISALLILGASILCGLIALHQRQIGAPLVKHWSILASGLVFMSFDEATQIHDGILGPMFSSYFGRGEGIWHFGWYVPFIPLVVAIAIYFMPFLKRIPRKYVGLFILAGCVYVGGAIGVEMIQSYISYHEIGGGAMAMSLLIEEMCEMMGMVVLIYTLLLYMSEEQVEYSISVPSQRPKVKAADHITFPNLGANP